MKLGIGLEVYRAKRIDLRDNYIHDNNKPNTARPGSILSFIPPGLGILYLGVDDSLVAGNRVENNVLWSPEALRAALRAKNTRVSEERPGAGVFRTVEDVASMDDAETLAERRVQIGARQRPPIATRLDPGAANEQRYPDDLVVEVPRVPVEAVLAERLRIGKLE